MRFMTKEEISRPLPISIGLSGGSGSGKTYSALRLARGIAEELGGKGAPVAFVDTENRRALHYREHFPEITEHYVDFGPNGVGFSPERWIDLLGFIEEAKVSALVVDSWSHSWAGIGGVLELQAEVLAALGAAEGSRAEANNIRAWAAVKPRYRKLIDRVIQFPVPIILCTRAKPVIMKRQKIGAEWVDVPVGKTKTRSKDMPWDVVADGDLLFEMTTMAILDHEHPGCPKYQVKIADQFKRLWVKDQPLTEETGRAMAKWSKRQDSAAADKALLDRARAAARGGVAQLQAWWKERSQDDRAIANTIMDELKSTAVEADERATQSDEIPFGPTPDELARAKEEALASARADEDAARQEEEA